MTSIVAVQNVPASSSAPTIVGGNDASDEQGTTFVTHLQQNVESSDSQQNVSGSAKTQSSNFSASPTKPSYVQTDASGNKPETSVAATSMADATQQSTGASGNGIESSAELTQKIAALLAEGHSLQSIIETIAQAVSEKLGSSANGQIGQSIKHALTALITQLQQGGATAPATDDVQTSDALEQLMTLYRQASLHEGENASSQSAEASTAPTTAQTAPGDPDGRHIGAAAQGADNTTDPAQTAAVVTEAVQMLLGILAGLSQPMQDAATSHPAAASLSKKTSSRTSMDAVNTTLTTTNAVPQGPDVQNLLTSRSKDRIQTATASSEDTAPPAATIAVRVQADTSDGQSQSDRTSKNTTNAERNALLTVKSAVSTAGTFSQSTSLLRALTRAINQDQKSATVLPEPLPKMTDGDLKEILSAINRSLSNALTAPGNQSVGTLNQPMPQSGKQDVAGVNLPITQDPSSAASTVKPSDISHASPMPTMHDTSDIFDQIVNGLNVRSNSGTSAIRIALTPPQLGDITVRLSMTGNRGLIADINAQTADVRNTIVANSHQLMKSFEEAGLKVSQIHINLTGQGLSSQTQGQATPEQKSGNRRAQFTGSTNVQAMDSDQTTTSGPSLLNGVNLSLLNQLV